MVSAEALLLGARLDEDHPPVTNGRMPVCRRCGAYTDGPHGHHHLPSDLRLDRVQDWLDAKAPRRSREIHRFTVNA